MVSAAVILPWTARNVQVTGQLVPVQLGAGEVFYLTTFSEWEKNETELWPRFFRGRGSRSSLLSASRPDEREALMFRAGLERISRIQARIYALVS